MDFVKSYVDWNSNTLAGFDCHLVDGKIPSLENFLDKKKIGYLKNNFSIDETNSYFLVDGKEIRVDVGLLESYISDLRKTEMPNPPIYISDLGDVKFVGSLNDLEGTRLNVWKINDRYRYTTPVYNFEAKVLNH